MIKKLLPFALILPLFAGGFVVYEDSKKVVVQCDDNRTSFSFDKDIKELNLKDKIEESIQKNCDN